MGEYARRLWKCRHFWLSLVKIDLKDRYGNSLLGLAWPLLQPLLMTTILCCVFCRAVQMDPLTYATYLLVSLSCWQYLVRVANQGCNCFIQAEPYIRQFPAPLAIYPLRITLAALINLLIALMLVLVVSLIRQGGLSLWIVPSLVVTLPCLVVFGLALATLTGLMTVYFREMRHLCEIGLTMLFYLTPVMYEAKMLQGSRLEWLVNLNPLTALLRLLRDPFLDGHLAPLSAHLFAVGTVAVLAALAGWLLARNQGRLVFAL